MTRRQFEREVVRERLRATRRGIAFCIVTLKLAAGPGQKQQGETLGRILLRNLRTTDEKGFLAVGNFAVVLVDTPEMGGRMVLDRLQSLFDEAGLAVRMELTVHDPRGFSPLDPLLSDRASGGRVRLSEVGVTAAAPLVPQPRLDALIKRMVDVIGAVIGIVCLGPLLLVAMAVIRLTSPGPAIYRQKREGLHGKAFTIYKLRTMVDGAEKSQDQLRAMSHRDGPAFKIDRDPRVTPVGRLLRATCMDELPQLWNVLKGDMSLVGPRPLPWDESRACDAWHRRRLDVLPGLTCFWQVDKARAPSFDDWMRLDLEYVDRRNLWVDVSLVCRTVAVALSGRGSR